MYLPSSKSSTGTISCGVRTAIGSASLMALTKEASIVLYFSMWFLSGSISNTRYTCVWDLVTAVLCADGLSCLVGVRKIELGD